MISQKAIKTALDALTTWADINKGKPGITLSKDDNNIYIYLAQNADIPLNIQELLDSLLHSTAKKNPDGSWEITISKQTTKG